MSASAPRLGSRRGRVISDVVFAVQLVCALGLCFAQVRLMQTTVAGASVTWFAFWLAFLLINLVLAIDAYRETPNRVSWQTVAIYAVWSLVIATILIVLLSAEGAAWNVVDTVTTVVTLGGVLAAIGVARARSLPVADPMVRAAFAVFFKAVPQLTLGWNMWLNGGEGVSTWAVVVGHVLIGSRLWQVWYAARIGGWDRNRLGIAVGEAANEASWIVATVVWILVR